MAQNTPNPQDEPIHTLHVYTNVLQIPTLVLSPDLGPVKGRIEENKFSVRVDSGPWFRATHVRREGDDPISLAILYSIYLGGYRKAVEDSLKEEKSKRWRETLKKVEAKRTQEAAASSK